MASRKYLLGELIEQYDAINDNKEFVNIADLQGINSNKYFQECKSNKNDIDLFRYRICRTRMFAYNRATSRNGEKISIALRTGKDCIVSPSYYCFRVIREDIVCPEYLDIWFKRPVFDRYARYNSWGSATEFFTFDDFCLTEIDLPSLEVQQKVVNNYKILSERISLLQKINELLIEIGTSMFVSIIVEHRKEIPQASLYEIAEYINGTSFDEDEYADSGLPIIKIAELKEGITASTQYFVGKKDSKYLIENGDVLFSWSGNPETSIDAFIWTHGNGILNQHTFKMKCPNGKAFTYFMLKYNKPEFVKAAHGKQTTGLGHVTVQDLKRLTIPFSVEKAKEFNSFADPIFMNIYNNLKEINLLTEIKKQLIDCL